jgi:hypothetical protein
LHDIVNLEGQGVPALFVASTEFVDAARTQAAALGFTADAVPGVFVPHPIQDRTDEEMRVLADEALDAVLAAATTGAA